MTVIFSFYKINSITDGQLSLLPSEHLSAAGSSYLPCYRFDIVLGGKTRVGKIDLRIGANDASRYIGNIGYTVYQEHRGRRYAARASRLVFPLAKLHGMEELLITCLPENIASYKTCSRLGGEYLGEIDIPTDSAAYRLDRTRVCRFRFDLSAIGEKSTPADGAALPED